MILTTPIILQYCRWIFCLLVHFPNWLIITILWLIILLMCTMHKKSYHTYHKKLWTPKKILWGHVVINYKITGVSFCIFPFFFSLVQKKRKEKWWWSYNTYTDIRAHMHTINAPTFRKELKPNNWSHEINATFKSSTHLLFKIKCPTIKEWTTWHFFSIFILITQKYNI